MENILRAHCNQMIILDNRLTEGSVRLNCPIVFGILRENILTIKMNQEEYCNSHKSEAIAASEYNQLNFLCRPNIFVFLQ